MEFHRRTLEMFGNPDPPLDRARGVRAARLAEAAGVVLPVAVAEWYNVLASSPLWRAFSRFDQSILLCEGDDPAKWWFGRPHCREEWTSNPWAVPPVCFDLRGWVPDPILPLMGECCGAWWWGVALNGAADPPVVITHDEGETWDLGGPSFSGYVYAALFDATFEDPRWCGREVTLEGRPLHGPARHQLRDQFRVEPASRVPYPFYSDLTERYAREGQRVSVANLETPAGARHRPDSRWRLWAADPDAFRDLVDRLSRIVPEFTGLAPAKGPLRIGMALPEAGESDFPF